MLPEEIVLAPGVFRIVYDIDMGNPHYGKPWLEFLAGFSLILFLMALVYLLVAEGIRLFRHAPDSAGMERILRFVAGVTAVTGWTTIIVLSKVTNYLTNLEGLAIFFGLPRDYPPVIFLAVLALLFIIFTVSLALATAIVWQRQSGSIWSRAFFTLVTMAAILFSGLMVRWDLHSLFF